MQRSEEITELAKALCNAQKTELFALKDSENPFFKSKYADLSSVWDAARKPLTDNGLSVVQTTEVDSEGGGVIVETMLLHISGQYITSTLKMIPEKDTPQAYGSALTYGRRYGLSALIGVCPEDDDGEGSMARKKTAKEKGKGESKPPASKDDRTSAMKKKHRALCAEAVGKERASELYEWTYAQFKIPQKTQKNLEVILKNWEKVVPKFKQQNPDPEAPQYRAQGGEYTIEDDEPMQAVDPGPPPEDGEIFPEPEIMSKAEFQDLLRSASAQIPPAKLIEILRLEKGTVLNNKTFAGIVDDVDPRMWAIIYDKLEPLMIQAGEKAL